MEEKINFNEESDKLIQLFKEFEKLVKQKCEEMQISTGIQNVDSMVNELCKKNIVFRRNKDDLDTIRIIRNLNSHNKGAIYKYVACPSPEMNQKLERIIAEIKNPPLIYNSSICIKRSNIYSKNISDTILDTVKVMSEKMYTHIPILENEKLVGVFSENTFLDIVRNENGFIVDEKTTFVDITNYIKIENHSLEEFLFISKNKNIYDVEEIFKNYFLKNKRIGCVYITESGKETESILGMLTAWDILGKE